MVLSEVGMEEQSSLHTRSLETWKNSRVKERSMLDLNMEIMNSSRKRLVTFKVKSNTSFSDRIINCAEVFQSAPSATNFVQVCLASVAVVNFVFIWTYKLEKALSKKAIIESRNKKTQSSYYPKVIKRIQFEYFPTNLFHYDALSLTVKIYNWFKKLSSASKDRDTPPHYTPMHNR